MIKYRLGCADGHEFESWFRSIADYDKQSRSGAVTCPLCASTEISKLPMAPAVVSARGNKGAPAPEHLPAAAPSAPPSDDAAPPPGVGSPLARRRRNSSTVRPAQNVLLTDTTAVPLLMFLPGLV